MPKRATRFIRPGSLLRIGADTIGAIVVATADFEIYYGVVAELRERSVSFHTIEPGEDLPENASVAIVGPEDEHPPIRTVSADSERPRQSVEAALSALRGTRGRTVIGIDPGDRPGIAVLSGEMVVAVFQVPAEDVADVVARESEDAADPVVKIGDGARLKGASIIDDIEDVPIELVDETGTTPSQGTGVRGAGDVLAAINIARLDGDQIESREIQPTAGEIRLIQNRSREFGNDDRSIDEALARKVALGELSIEAALAKHRGR